MQAQGYADADDSDSFHLQAQREQHLAENSSYNQFNGKLGSDATDGHSRWEPALLQQDTDIGLPPLTWSQHPNTSQSTPPQPNFSDPNHLRLDTLRIASPIDRSATPFSQRAAVADGLGSFPSQSTQYSNTFSSQPNELQPHLQHGEQMASYYTAEEPSTYETADEGVAHLYQPPIYNQFDEHPQYHSALQPHRSYDPLYAAASSVLGGPPPETSNPLVVLANQIQSYPNSTTTPFPYENSKPQLPRNPYPSNRQPTGQFPGQSLISTPNLSVNSEPLSILSDTDSRRPSLHRADDTFSVTPSTRKSKAVDLNHPPFTRQYVEEYRARIKGDPDPEAHFRYAKYLIDAAKKIGAELADQKAVRKYRDSLIVESLKVIRRLATQGETYPEAQFFLANCHGTGTLGLQIDHERAYHLYLQAAKQNHPSSAYRVAVCNEIGAGTRRDTSRAFAFYRKAASLGDTPAMYKLGMILLTGSLGQPKNPREAIGWLKRAAEQADEENPHALHELGLLHEMPNSSIVVHDDAYAKELFTRAANLGYTQSQFKLGQCYEFGTVACPIDPRRSIAWYTKAAEKGDPEAELALSGWYLTGSEGVLKQSDSEAYLWARRAANKGLSKAEYAVGYYAEVGIGVKQDLELAKRWYMRSAAQGNKRAMSRLTELKREGNKKRTTARPTRQQANKDECVDPFPFPPVTIKGESMSTPRCINKRPSDDGQEDASCSQASKKPRMHPFFELAQTRNLAKFWQPNISNTCKHGINGSFVNSSKLAIFDLDGTIILPKEGRKFPKSASDWQWWRKEVPLKLQQLHQQGFALVILSNQNLSSAKLKIWTEKIPIIADAISDIPFRILAATALDIFRKPLPGMWCELERMALRDSISIGDAAGRPGDHSASDRKWAMNAGLKFYTPEEFFLGLPPAPYILDGFNATALLTEDLPKPPPCAAHLPSDKPEIVVFVGSPGLGKTTFYYKHFEKHGYVHINQDQLKRRDKCLTVATEALSGAKSCVIDNTNRDVPTRMLYINLARKFGCSIRCFVFRGTLDLAWHNVVFRTLYTSFAKEPKMQRALLPRFILETFFKQYEEPQLKEGFHEIEYVDWAFDGNEEKRKWWTMWLDL